MQHNDSRVTSWVLIVAVVVTTSGGMCRFWFDQFFFSFFWWLFSAVVSHCDHHPWWYHLCHCCCCWLGHQHHSTVLGIGYRVMNRDKRNSIRCRCSHRNTHPGKCLLSLEDVEYHTGNRQRVGGGEWWITIIWNLKPLTPTWLSKWWCACFSALVWWWLPDDLHSALVGPQEPYNQATHYKIHKIGKDHKNLGEKHAVTFSSFGCFVVLGHDRADCSEILVVIMCLLIAKCLSWSSFCWLTVCVWMLPFSTDCCLIDLKESSVPLPQLLLMRTCTTLHQWSSLVSQRVLVR